ncbi:MAG: DUF2029 domain-containing protein, partial [Planctomycetaceae bacterium]
MSNIEKTGKSEQPKWSLPFVSPLPADPMKASLARIARVAAYVLLAVAMIVPIFQLYHGIVKYQKEQVAFHKKYGQTPPPGVAQPKKSKGAMDRWRKAVRQFWAGENIYLAVPKDKSRPAVTNDSAGDEGGAEDSAGLVRLHPNMPFTVMLMTPFSYGKAQWASVYWTIAKIVLLVFVFLMAVSVTNHAGMRMPDWVLGLALLWCVMLIVSDLQHGNTNVFVLVAIVLHLWLFRKGKDMLSGASLALAICLKMTPAIFVLYWLYQRNWKVLAGCLLALAMFTVIIPAGACVVIEHGDLSTGMDHFATLNQTWLDNLSVPGLVKSASYPVYINQSLPGVMYRFLMGGENGDIYWNPDDNPYITQTEHGWINFADLTTSQAKWVIRALQMMIVLAIGWAIGWRRLPRDDGRRALQYGLVVIGMLILNQRTWDHHAGVMLIASLPIWYAIAFGNISRKARAWAIGLALAAGPMIWFMGTDMFLIAGKLSGYGKDAGKVW